MATAEQQQSAHRAAAIRAAEAAIIKHTMLRGKDAAKVAEAVVTRVTGDLAAERDQKLAGTSRAEVTAAGVTALVGLALSTGIVIDVIRRGGRAARVCAATNIAINVGLVGYGQYRKHRVRQGARAQLGAAGATS